LASAFSCTAAGLTGGAFATTAGVGADFVVDSTACAGAAAALGEEPMTSVCPTLRMDVLVRLFAFSSDSMLVLNFEAMRFSVSPATTV
jgi:hypothetical protein